MAAESKRERPFGGAEIAFFEYRGKCAIRFKGIDGSDKSWLFEDRDEAHEYFLMCIDRLKREIAERKSQISDPK